MFSEGHDVAMARLCVHGGELQPSGDIYDVLLGWLWDVEVFLHDKVDMIITNWWLNIYYLAYVSVPSENSYWTIEDPQHDRCTIPCIRI